MRARRNTSSWPSRSPCHPLPIWLFVFGRTRPLHGDFHKRTDQCGKQFLVSSYRGRATRPSSEGVIERSRSLVAEQPRNLRKRQASFLYALTREALPQLIHNLLVSRTLVGQFARERSLAKAQRPGDGISSCLAVREQLMHLALDCGSYRSQRRAAVFCSLLANGLKRLKQMSIFGDKREGQRFMRECELIA